MHSEQLPFAILADRLDCSENDRAARLVEQVRALRQTLPFEKSQGRFISAHRRAWLVVIAIDCAAGIAVKVSAVAGKRDEICHFWECLTALRILTHSLTVAPH